MCGNPTIKPPFIARRVIIGRVSGNADGIQSMIGTAWVGIRTRQWAALCVGLVVCIAAQTVAAADCPGHPDALGTSRTIVVDPQAHPRIGTMQYPETLPLEDHEVVLTFDDGPLPRNSNQVLEILASQCVKATFFTIGRMALAYPEGVRKLRDAGGAAAMAVAPGVGIYRDLALAENSEFRVRRRRHAACAVAVGSGLA
jgi:hypothetical protein